MKARWIGVVFLFLMSVPSWAQYPQASFLISESACLNENIKITNQSLNADRYEWDFCQGDLSGTPTAEFVATVPGNVTVGIDLVFDGTNWFGFATSRETNSIKRLDFGTSTSSTPLVVDLGNPGNISPWRPIDIKVVHDNGEWFAFVYGESTNLITRIDFGSSLSNSSGLVAEVILTGTGNSNCGLDAVRQGNQWVIAYSNSFSLGTVVLNTIRSVPTASDMMHTGNLPGVLNFGDVALIYSNNNWYGYLPASGSQKLFRATFGTNPLNVPAVTDISNGHIGTLSPYGIDIGIDQNQYIAIISTIEGPLLRINLGSNLDDPPVSGNNLGALGLLASTLKVVLVKKGSVWTAATLSWNSGQFFRIDFPASVCNDMPSVVNQNDPIATFSSSGEKFISLRAFNGADYDEYHKSTLINSLQAPSLDFENNFVCVQSIIHFTLQSNQTIVSSDWLFGDLSASTDLNPSHQYSAPGNYTVSVQAAAAGGCENFVSRVISLYDQPVADFITPSVSPVCTNQSYSFINTSIYDMAYSPDWKWYVNEELISSEQNFTVQFLTSVSHEIKLVASIPGCASEAVTSIASVTEGPLVNFSFTGQCQDTPVSFTNATTGSVNGYSWDFGDGQNSTNENPLSSYDSPGTFDVTLTAFGTSGCNNTKTKSVTIYSKPQTDFSVAMPPFSCSGTPTQFTDITPNPFDSNLASWQWNFGDGSGSSAVRNPQYTFQNAGAYSVSFTATTNFGCSSTIQKAATISPSPVASFTNSPPCIGVPVNFTNTSTGSLQSQQWQIQSSFYTVANPVHAFFTSGDKNVILSVTSTNGCVSSVSRTLSVPTVLTPDFSVSRNCINQQTEFTDITNDAADPVVGYTWNFAGLGSGTENPQVFSFANTGSFNVSLSVTTQAGCVHSTAKNVSIINSPQAGFTATPSFGPPPLQVQFTNTSTNATGYLWEFNDPNETSSASVSPSFTFTDLGSYEVDLTAFNTQGCSSLFSKLIEVVIPFTDVALTQLELIETGQGSVKPAVTIQNKGNIALTNLPLLFEVNGTAFRTFVTTSIPPSSSYYYLSDFELPASTSLSFVCVRAEIEDLSPDDNQLCASVDQPIIVLAPYPNPATNQSYIEVQWIVRENRSTEVFLINSIGQTVYSERVNSVTGLNTLRLPATGFQAGLYFLHVRSGDFSRTHRLMVLE